MNIFGPALMIMAGRVLSFVATFFIPIVLVRVFTTAQFGAYKQIFLLFATISSLAQLGMAESLYYFLPRDPQKMGRYVLNTVLVLLGMGAICCAALTFDRQQIAVVFGNPDLARYFPLLGINVLVMMGSAALETVMISRKEYILASTTYAISDIVRAGVLILPAVTTRDLYWVVMGSAVFAALRLAAAVVYFQSSFGREFRPDKGLLKEQFSYALPFQFGGVLETTQSNLHQYVVSHFFSPTTFAIYSVGCLQIPLIDFLASPTNNVMMVRMSEEIRDGRPDSVVTIWHDTTRKLALVFFPLFGLMLVAAHTLITFLYTNRFAASVPIFMVWSTVVLLATMPAESVLRVYAQVRYLFVVKTVCLAFVVSLIYFFLMHFGLMGAVFVTILASCLAKTLCMVRMKKMMQVPVRQLLPWTSLAAVLGTTVISSTIAFAIQYLADVPALVSLCLTGGAMVTTYSGLLLTFGLLSASERAFFMRKVQQGIAFLRREPDVRSEVEV